MIRRRSGTLLLALVTALTACADRSGKTLDQPVFAPPEPSVASTLPPDPGPPLVDLAFELTAPWVDGATVPGRQTCLGDGVSPALNWANVPPEAVELAIAVIDLDADDFVHWLVYGLSPGEFGLVEGQPPEFASVGTNSAGSTGFESLCPPAGETHRYLFTLYALGQQLELLADNDPAAVVAQLEATTIATTSVSGLVTTDP